jgi:DNA invertase Pin-like site-specific DNA recombinase
LQIDALKEAGCEKWFLDKITGSKAERKGLDEAWRICGQGTPWSCGSWIGQDAR